MKLNKAEIIELVKKCPGQKVKVAIADIDGVLRGKVIHVEKFLGILEKGFGFCDVVFGWDMTDKCYENSDYTGWHSGYPDAIANVDLSTFRKVPWDNDIPFFLADFGDANGGALEICPRQLLKKVRAKAQKMGFKPIFAQEYEWFNFQETPESLHQKGFTNPDPISKGMFGYSIIRSSQKSDFFNALFDELKKFDIQIEGLHTETGPGVFEAAIMYDEILEAADRSVLFKTAVKEVAGRYGIMPTFMAKWNENLPGCSGHIHSSLWDTEGKKNLFYDAQDEKKMSSTMKSYMAGVLKLLPDFLPLYAPTINSYKRLVEGMWAPTTLTWAIDNRTTTLRALPGSMNSTRLELRVVGSDMNPYLAMAGCLAAGLYGIENNLKLDVPETIGNGYANKSNGVLPRNLWDATQKFKNGQVANEIFGEKFVSHFAKTREWEWSEFSKSVTNWEMKRYFEII